MTREYAVLSNAQIINGLEKLAEKSEPISEDLFELLMQNSNRNGIIQAIVYDVDGTETITVRHANKAFDVVTRDVDDEYEFRVYPSTYIEDSDDDRLVITCPKDGKVITEYFKYNCIEH